MSSIGAIGSYSTSYSPYSTISAGGALQNAAQDAAGLAINERTEAQTRGLDQGEQNLNDAKSAANIKDGALDGITDYLQSIRELAVKASNGTLNDQDRSYIQGQIDQYLKGIDDIANGTTFNEKKLLDGSTPDMKIATGTGTDEQLSTTDSTVASLGLSGFDVTSGNFDIKDIDNALKTVQDARTATGAETNRFEYASGYNSKASLELNGFTMDQDEDRTMKALQELKAKQVTDQYQVMLQKKQQEDEAHKSQLFFA